jgi:MATE family, multidrug efflux pump
MKVTLQAPPAVVTAPSLNPRTQRILHAPILSTLLRLAAPNIVVVMVQALSSAVDAFYLGRLGAEVLAGIALVFPLWTLMVTTSAGALGGGISSSIARALGAGRRADADAAVAHALILSTAAAFVFSAVVLAGGPLLYRAMGGGGGPAVDAALAYSTIVFGGALVVWLVNGLASVLRGSGEMFVPASVIVGGECLHMLLAPVLIFVFGLGTFGAGLSLVISYAVRALALGGYMLTGRASVHLPEGPLRLRRGLFWDILRVGLPGSLNTLMSNLNVLAITGLVASSGVVALAGYGLAARLQFLLIPLVFGMGTALVTMVGTNIGAGQFKRARRVAWTGSGVAAVATGSVGLVVALAPTAWLGLFTGDASVLAFGSLYLRVVGPTFALFGLGLALYFAAQGAGRVAPALLGGFVSLVISVGGGSLIVNWLHADVVWLFAAIATALVLFGVIQALAVNIWIHDPLRDGSA